MSTPTVREIVKHERKAYRKASKSAKKLILDELEELNRSVQKERPVSSGTEELERGEAVHRLQEV